MKKSDTWQALTAGMSDEQIRLHHEVLQAIHADTDAFLDAQVGRAGQQYFSRQVLLAEYLKEWIELENDSITRLHEKYDEFVQQHSHALNGAERRHLVIDFAAVLGSSPGELKKDRKAFKRWFGFEAVSERYQRKVAQKGRDTGFVLQRLGQHCVTLLAELDDLEKAANVWKRISLDELLVPLIGESTQTPIRLGAFYALSRTIRQLPKDLRRQCLDDTVLSLVYRASLDRREDVWVQCEALTLLSEFSAETFAIAIKERLSKPGPGDDLFVRRRALKLCGSKLSGTELADELLSVVVTDPSAAVRQKILPSFLQGEEKEIRFILDQIVLRDQVEQVRAGCLHALLQAIGRTDLVPVIIKTLKESLENEQAGFVVQVALHTVSRGYFALLEEKETTLALAWQKQLLPLLRKHHLAHPDKAVRRYASVCYRQIYTRADSKTWALVTQLLPVIVQIRSGKSAKLPRKIVEGSDETSLAAALHFLALDDHGLDVEVGRRHIKVTRGFRFTFRWWRFLYELRNPSTDKRQAFNHTVGRFFQGNIRIPSGVMSELAKTRVPGEPLFVEEERGWRPYLPLVDDLLGALDLPFSEKSLRIYSSEGMTEVFPPSSLAMRIKAKFKLTAHYSLYADLRNWNEGDTQTASAYLEKCQALGFRFDLKLFSPQECESWDLDPSVKRFFPTLLPLSFSGWFDQFDFGRHLYAKNEGTLFGSEYLKTLSGYSPRDWAERGKDYFFSVYENKLNELILFILMVGSYFVAKHLWKSHQIKTARKSIALVIGGWGTRGKSGTERLKAALFNALGYSVVSKTTGCEAMFLHCHAEGPLREMFLFRPYDKATIWEQADVLQLAQKLQTEVFLWECMGLTPAYIDILQQQWMQDDISTITNTYPDHEDLQGPAGINIPQVMTNFIPPRSKLFTTEEQMLPILTEAARERNTQTVAVGWLEAGLLAPDLLARFPYEEHPYNIALVLAMAADLGIDEDFAMREMADRVVADLGVLKVSPMSRAQGRFLQFTNGMSANERFGCLTNWHRVKYDSHDTYQEPAVWLTTVVNNRADRIPRSQVFATLLVSDLMVDKHLIIGTNLDGFQKYIKDSWSEYSKELTLWPATKNSLALEVLEKTARRYRVLYRKEFVRNELTVMLKRLSLQADVDAMIEAPESIASLTGISGQQAEDLQGHLLLRQTQLDDYTRLAAKLEQGADQPSEALDNEFRKLLWSWFERKLTFVQDAHASGEEVIAHLLKITPPGILNRVMGIQNIKGTGLDFVYRWQAWESCYSYCQKLLDDDEVTAQQGLAELAAFQDIGTLSEEYIREAIAHVKHKQVMQNERSQAQLKVVLINVDLAMEKVNGALKNERSGGDLWSRVIEVVEAFWDAGDAVKRRKQANTIYKDLTAQRISHAQAAMELQQLNKRQKGGWLQHLLHSSR